MREVGSQVPKTLESGPVVMATRVAERNTHPVRHPQPVGSTLSLGALARAFRYRWLLALTVGLCLGTPAAVTAWLLVPTKYTTVAMVRILPSEPALFAKDEHIAESERTSYQRTQATLVTSRPVLNEALKSDKVRALKGIRQQPDPVAWLEKELKVGFVEDSDLMRLAMSGTDPNEITILVNAVFNSYLELAIKGERNGQRAKADDLHNIYLSAQENLRKEKEKLSNLAQRLKTADPQAMSLKQKNALEDHAAYKRELALVQSQLRVAEMKLRLCKTELELGEKAEVPTAVVEDELDRDLEYQRQKEEVQRLSQRYEAVKESVRANHPLLSNAENSKQAAEKELERLREKRLASATARVRAKINQEYAVQVRKLEEEIRTLREQQEVMSAEEKKLRGDAENIGTASFEIEAMRVEIGQAEEVLKSLRAEKERVQMETQSSQRRVVPVHEAEIPRLKSIKERILATVCTGGCAFLCGAFLVCYREFRTRKVHHAEELLQNLELKIIGSLPTLPRRFLAGSNAEDGYWGRIVSEAVSYIRTRLLAHSGGKVNQALMVASADAREGKTMLAGHLAMSIAQTGRRTLLIDGDLRRPSLSRLFDIPAAPGFRDVLCSESDVLAAVCPSGIDNLFILPAGECSLEAIQKLDHANVEHFFQKLRTQFDCILMDSSPLLVISDSLQLSKYVDGVVLCVRQHVSRLPSVLAACERLRDLNRPLLGIVVNGVRHERRPDAYPYYLLPSKEEVPTTADTVE